MPANEEVALRFGRNLYLQRRALGISQEELARGAALHRTEIGNLESGERTPRIDTLARLTACLSCSTDALMEGIEWVVPRPVEGRFVIGEPWPTDDLPLESAADV